MQIPKNLKEIERLINHNSPVILTAVGVAGTITTAYLAGKASIKAHQILEEARYNGVNRDPKVLTKKEQFQKVWKLYIPAVAVGTFTCAAVIGSNRIGTRRAAAVASAYAISEKAAKEYKEKVLEKIGVKKEEEVRAEVAQDRIDRDQPTPLNVIKTGNGSVWFRDDWSGRYFESDMEAVKAAQNNINYKILREDYASLTDFYQELKLPSITNSDNLGWNRVNEVELTFATGTTDDGRVPVHTFSFRNAPEPNMWRAHR